MHFFAFSFKWQFLWKYTVIFLLLCSYFKHQETSFPISNFAFLTIALDLPLPLYLFHPFFLFSLLCGLSFLKMKHRLPTSGTSTIFMLSQTASTHSFSWSDWGLFYASIIIFPSLIFKCFPWAVSASLETRSIVFPLPLSGSFFPVCKDNLVGFMIVVHQISTFRLWVSLKF